MLFNIDSMYLNALKIYKYATTNYGYNLFIIDELDTSLLEALRGAIRRKDKLQAIGLSKKVEAQMDAIRDSYCYNRMPYRSNFRAIAKDMTKFLKKTWVRYDPSFSALYKMLAFISTSDYYVIREYLIHRSYGLHYMQGIEVDPYSFPSNYYPVEFILAYATDMLKIFFKK